MFSKTLQRNLSLEQPITFHANTEAELRDRIRLWMDLNQASCDGLCYVLWDEIHTFARMNCEEMDAFQDWHEGYTDEELINAIVFWLWPDWDKFAFVLKYEEDPMHLEEGWEIYDPRERAHWTFLHMDYGFVDDLKVSDSRKAEERKAWAWLDAQNDFLNEVFR